MNRLRMALLGIYFSGVLFGVYLMICAVLGMPVAMHTIFVAGMDLMVITILLYQVTKDEF